jgi:hypothetical protein
VSAASTQIISACRYIGRLLRLENDMDNRPRDLADRIISRRKPDETLLRVTFTLPVEVARTKAREILNELPQGVIRRLSSNGGNCQTDRSSSLCAVCGQRIEKYQ